MTALKQYQRLEASGLWRPEPDAERREVIVSLGDASLTISEFSGRALAHWSLAAVRRANRGPGPAIYHPDGDPGETLELAEDETTMIEAIERLLRAIDRRRPRRGKLRLLLVGGLSAVLVLGGVFWLPGALVEHTRQVVPAVKREEIGAALLSRITRVAGQPCMTEEARQPLRRLALRTLGETRQDDLVVLPGGVEETAHLPGGIILLNRALIEDYEDPDVTAGYVLAEAVRARRGDPFGELLDHAGLWASLKLLTTGSLPESALDTYTEAVLAAAPGPVPTEALLRAFDRAQMRSTAYGLAREAAGDDASALIASDPHAEGGGRLVLTDADWIRLQGICSG